MDFSQQQILSNRLQDKLPELICVSHCQLASLLYQLVDGLISFWVMQKIRNIIHGSIGKLKLDFITLCTQLCIAKQGLTSLQGFLSFFTLLSTNKTMNCLYFKNIYKKTCTTTPLFAFEIWICRICKGHFHKSTISPLLQGVNSIYQLLLFIFHLFCLNLFLLLCFIVGSKDFQTEISNK